MTYSLNDPAHVALVRTNYEGHWSKVLARIEELERAGETSLARMLNITFRETLRPVENHRSTLLHSQQVPAPFYLGFLYIRDAIAQKLLELCEQVRPTAIVELGCGWGYNLFNLWLKGGPRDCTYYGLEFTEAGRAAAYRLAQLAGGPNISVGPLDYASIDAEWRLRQEFERCLIFTCHSVEQVEVLPAWVLEDILASSRKVTCCHFEPIGWQISEGAGVHANADLTRANSIKRRYNRNLWSLLLQFEAEGKIAIREVLRDEHGTQPIHSTSIVTWDKVVQPR